MSGIMGQYNATPPTLEDKAVELLQLDENGYLKVVNAGGGGAGDASASNQLTQIAAEEAIQAAAESIDGKVSTSAKQDDQTALLEEIRLQTQIGAGWFGKSFKKILFSDMTVSGIDLTAFAPAGQKCIAVMAARGNANGQVIYLEAQDNLPGVFVDFSWGNGATWYGCWKTIGPATLSAVFPLWAVYT